MGRLLLATLSPTRPHLPLLLESSAQPLVRALPRAYTPEYCFERLAALGGCVWLDSNLQSPELQLSGLGRYSYLAADPFSKIRVDEPVGAVLDQVAGLLHQFYQPRIPDLPPMQGGWMGWLGYELGRTFERLPTARYNEFQLPAAALGLYDVVLSWDHQLEQGWIVSQGWPMTESMARARHAYRRLQHFLRVLEAPAPPLASSTAPPRNDRQYRLRPSQLASQYPTRWSPEWTSNFSTTGFREAVSRCVEYIHAGDIFQVNLAQRLIRRAICPPEQLYLHLRQKNPAPFSGYADFGRTQVISCSPERFVRVLDREVETRPIKGTRPRLSDPIADAGIAQLLLQSAKDRSENVMIVDLLRNDLSRVAEPASLKVTQLCGLEQYRFVWHLVSVVTARLGTGKTPAELLTAMFPGGSITGAPKIRAMEIIAELEPTARGPYCGSLGYWSFAGDMDTSILIRTVTACDGWWQVPVGGGIVAASDPHLEEQETWHKAEGILRAIDSLDHVSCDTMVSVLPH
ncbi:MAG: aminodeoxychorismate synthase component I [Pirellulaceae bacterium]|nr:aminodeoxychorismate synthase component I [Pirellulaceae bacterium]